MLYIVCPAPARVFDATFFAPLAPFEARLSRHSGLSLPRSTAQPQPPLWRSLGDTETRRAHNSHATLAVAQSSFAAAAFATRVLTSRATRVWPRLQDDE